MTDPLIRELSTDHRDAEILRLNQELTNLNDWMVAAADRLGPKLSEAIGDRLAGRVGDVVAERDRYRSALELIASGTVGPAIMRMTACEVLGLEPPVWTHVVEGPADA